MTLTDSTFSANSTNIITDTYTWSGTVHLAANVTLIFQGGKLIGGTLQGNNTVIQAPCSQIFSNVQFTGTFVVENWNACWFGCVGDGTTNNTTALQYAINALYSLLGMSLTALSSLKICGEQRYMLIRQIGLY